MDNTNQRGTRIRRPSKPTTNLPKLLLRGLAVLPIFLLELVDIALPFYVLFYVFVLGKPLTDIDGTPLPVGVIVLLGVAYLLFTYAVFRYGHICLRSFLYRVRCYLETKSPKRPNNINSLSLQEQRAIWIENNLSNLGLATFSFAYVSLNSQAADKLNTEMQYEKTNLGLDIGDENNGWIKAYYDTCEKVNKEDDKIISYIDPSFYDETRQDVFESALKKFPDGKEYRTINRGVAQFILRSAPRKLLNERPHLNIDDLFYVSMLIDKAKNNGVVPSLLNTPRKTNADVFLDCAMYSEGKFKEFEKYLSPDELAEIENILIANKRDTANQEETDK